ncbi:MAG: UDP-N-acetylglucosamine 2-epimerase (non-hydrolyzing) [Bacteroidales bacterium]|nr:UDP-N-acetylglucosamine 2-epimerase (non-hydrolyzing) [Bacteroidales bacterium]
MIKIVTIIGARPQIIKAAALSRAIKNHFSDKIKEVIVHTGQHYDENMSQVFFDELGIPAPDYNLGVGSGSHGVQTAKMIEGIEEILLKENPDYLVVYGDTNSTLAGAMAASKIHIPIAHIEAGLRSFNKAMPEEINRICCDHCSTLLFSPTATGYNNLIKEGFTPKNKKPFTIDNPGIYHCGDVMYDNSLYFSKTTRQEDNETTSIVPKSNYILCTIHRNNNTDEPKRLNSVVKALLRLSEEEDIIIPLHPRTKKLLSINLETETYRSLIDNKRIYILEPVSFLGMIMLEKKASLVITDSGGVQKESYFFKKPCIIIRSETEWREIVEVGAAIIADADEEKIIDGYYHFKEKKDIEYPEIFGDGKAAEFICNELISNKKSKIIHKF